MLPSALPTLTAPALTVSQLNRRVRLWLEDEMGIVAVLGELSNFSRPASGHSYFTLKDKEAQLKCAYFKQYQPPPAIAWKDGQQVLAVGRLSLYEARGDYQLLVHTLSPQGQGALTLQFEALKKKLEQQGLFADARKRPLPRYPEHIGIITSATGAALQDMLITLKRRYPLAAVWIYPCEVQGKNAAPALINAIGRANRDAACEVLLLARGGGSMEDLWAFNDEMLAFAIYSSHIPIITGIGHETDVTIADLVADYRAATPTAAAQVATPDQIKLHALLLLQQQRLQRALQSMVLRLKAQLQHLTQILGTPERLLEQPAQRLDFLTRQLKTELTSTLDKKRHQLHRLHLQLETHNPLFRMKQARSQCNDYQHRLHAGLQQALHRARARLIACSSILTAINPLATLERGYAIASQNGNLLTNSHQVIVGQTIEVRLSHGQLVCEVLRRRQSYA